MNIRHLISIKHENLFSSFKNLNNLFLFSNWLQYLQNSLANFQQNINRIHQRKLKALGIIRLENDRTQVYNLSIKNINPNIIKILENGPNFSFKPNKFSELRDKIEIENLIGNIKFNHSHSNNITNESFEKLTKEIRTVSESYFREQKLNTNPSNKNNDLKILKKFMKDDSLLILKSDKGNSLVIVDTTTYFSFGHSFFKTDKFVQSLDHNEKNFNLLKRLLSKLKSNKQISDIEYKMMLPQNYRTPIAYFLPKTHKPDFMTNCKFRPIISCFNSYFSNLAKYLAEILKDEIQSKSKGTFDFLEKLNQFKIENTHKMIGLDVENLFPSIPLKEVLEKAAEFLQKRLGKNIEKIYIIKLLELCTKDCCFKFGDIIYQQLNGVQMGSPLSPILAEIYLTEFEKEKLKNENLGFDIEFYYRYVDDIFMVVDNSVTDNMIFLAFNKLNKNLKFTVESERDYKINFFDISIVRQNNIFSTSWYRKSSNTLNFTRWNSFGPQKYKINLIYTMVNRLLKICSNKENLHRDIAELKNSLYRSGYPFKIVENTIFRALNKKPLKNLIAERQKLYLGIQFVNNKSVEFSRKLSKTIQKYFGFIEISTYYRKEKPLLAYFSSKIKPSASSMSTGVYQIRCEDCNAFYIGETGRPFKLRLNEHITNSINLKNSSAIVDHYKIGHKMDFDHSSIILNEDNLRKRKIAESFFIRETNTIPGNKSSQNLLVFKN